MSIFSEFGGEITVISREPDLSGGQGYTITHDHVFTGSPVGISLHTSLCRMHSEYGDTRAGATIGINEVDFLDESGAPQRDIFGERVSSGPGGIGEDQWPSVIYHPRVLGFTIAVFAIEASIKGSWFVQVWE
jgi:hypothetical protein